MKIDTNHWSGPAETAEVGTNPMAVESVMAKAQTKRRNLSKPNFGPREEVADLKSEVEYLRRQVQGLRSRLHGELAVLALRIEDNDRWAMRRRRVVRPFLMPGLLLFGVTVGGGLAILLLTLHNEADERDHKDRYANWFRFYRDG